LCVDERSSDDLLSPGASLSDRRVVARGRDDDDDDRDDDDDNDDVIIIKCNDNNDDEDDDDDDDSIIINLDDWTESEDFAELEESQQRNKQANIFVVVFF
jgi:hypothetical protein